MTAVSGADPSAGVAVGGADHSTRAAVAGVDPSAGVAVAGAAVAGTGAGAAVTGTDAGVAGAGATEQFRTLVLAGGLSYERDVSLRSGRRALDALRRARVEVELRDVDADLLAALTVDPPDAVVIALHGEAGEDGSLRGVLDLIGIPYVGSDAHAARVAWDKPTAKAVLQRAGIRTPDWVALPHDIFSELGAQKLMDRILARLGLPLMVKPASGGSGLGVHAVHTPAELPTAMVACFAYGSTALVEQFVPGADIAVSVLDLDDGPVALPAVEIVPPNGGYDYAARYTAGITTWHVPARLDPAVAAAVGEVAVAVHRTLGLRDMSRVDVIVDATGTPHVLEANVAPGMTETSLLPMAVDAAGLDFGTVLVGQVRQAIARAHQTD